MTIQRCVREDIQKKTLPPYLKSEKQKNEILVCLRPCSFEKVSPLTTHSNNNDLEEGFSKDEGL